ncbi:MAG: NAD-dependent epimerase/dehydratase family protein [bacterium]
MKILITGGAGFIGSHIQDRYVALGHDVTVLDNFATGKREYLNPKAKLAEGSVTDEEFVRGVFENGKFDLVNHHAAQINVRYSFEDPVRDCRVNVLGTLVILKAIIDFGVKKIIFASTGGAIYGSPEKLPVDEKSPLRPESPYAISKMTCENYIRNLGELYGFKFVILRYANVFGPRQIPKGEAGVVAIFCERMLEGKRPIIFGSGDHTRDYVYVEDVGKANELALSGGDGFTFNVGTGIKTDVHEVYDAVAGAFGEKALKPETAPEVPEVAHIALDCAFVKKELGWSPEIDFLSGVGLTVKSFGVGNRS